MNQLLPAVTELLKKRLGLASASIGDRVVESILRRRMAAVGTVLPSDYLKWLTTQPGEMAALIEAIVVPESWFFRYPESFAVLVQTAQRRTPPPAPGLPFRVLCSPCSTGEEVYSAAVALLAAGIPAEAIEIVGTDISVDALTKARDGVYSPSSFREADPQLFTALLNAVPVQTNGKRAVKDAVKQVVRFRELNLVDPSARMPTGLFDVVFCRNLLIYLTDQARELVLKRLDAVLAPTGILLLGHAEGSALTNAAMEPIGRPQAFAFRRKSSVNESTPARVTPPPRPTPPFVTPVRAVPPPSGPPRPETPVPSATVPDLETIERQVDAGMARPMLGDLEMTAALNPSAKVYTLLGTAYSMLGNPVEAERAFTQAVYLEPTCYEALVQLLAIAERRGDAPGADNYRRRAAKADRGLIR